MAIVDAGETKPTKDNMAQASNELLYLFENATTGTIDKYVKGATGNDTDGYTLELATVSKQDTNGFAAVTETETRENDGYLATLTAGQSKYFLFSVWLEGTENDDQDAAVDGIINVVLNFTSTKVSA